MRFTRWLLVLVWMGLIFFASSQPVLPSAPSFPLLDILFKKSGHMLGYAVLMVLVLWALRVRDEPIDTAHTLLAFAIVLVYATSDEVHQSFVPNRTSLWTDVAIFDFAGSCMGWVAWHWRRMIEGRSRFAWLYLILFLYGLAVAILFNLPYRGRAVQDSAVLFKDAWFLWGFSYFGLLLTTVAALLIEDGLRRRMKWLGYVIPYFVVGILPLSIFMARRPLVETQSDVRVSLWLQRFLERRWFWWLMPLITIAISLFWLPQGSLAQFINTMSQNTGLWFMALDIPLNHIVALPLLQADMQRRGVTQQTIWLIAALLTGPIGLGIYLATRPHHNPRLLKGSR